MGSEEVFGIIFLWGIRRHEHHKIDGHVGYLAVLANLTFVGDDSGCLNVVIGILQKVIEGAVYGIVLARLDFYRMGTHGRVVVNQIVYLALLAVVVVKEFVPMCTKFLGYHTFGLMDKK